MKFELSLCIAIHFFSFDEILLYDLILRNVFLVHSLCQHPMPPSPRCIVIILYLILVRLPIYFSHSTAYLLTFYFSRILCILFQIILDGNSLKIENTSVLSLIVVNDFKLLLLCFEVFYFCQ